MTPDDPRHGTNAGAQEHVRTDTEVCQPCRDAHAAYKRSLWRKKYLLGVDNLYIPATGTIRRIRALQAMGWRFIDIDRALGRDPKGQGASLTHNITSQTKVHLNTYTQIADVYERLCMTFGPSKLGRTRALTRGFIPPLMWDDIDNPDEQPTAWEYRERKRVNGTTADLEPIDPVVIQRILDGDWRLPASPAERVEIARLWVADGGAVNELSRRTGWKVDRYLKLGEVA